MAFIPPPPRYHDDGVPTPLVMSDRERALRDMFVSEYLIDYSATRACMRCGFPKEFASEWAEKFMSESYVQQRLTSVALTPIDAKQEEDFNRSRIKAQLLREAHYYGPGSSHAARVAALANLMKIYSLEGVKKGEVTIKHQGGVMVAPGVASLDSWEAAAISSQDALTRDASS